MYSAIVYATTNCMVNMFLLRYILFWFSFGYACKIKIFNHVDKNYSSGNSDKLLKMVESSFEKRDKELQANNALLRKTSGILNDMIAKMPTGDLTKLEKVIDPKFRKIDKEIQEFNAKLQKVYRLLNDLMTKMFTEQPLVDVARGKTAQQSSTLDPMYNASKALDGNKATFSHTKKENGPVWWLDLGQDYIISRIEMLNREDCCGHYFHDVDVTVGPNLKNMTLCSSYKGPATTKEHIVLKCKEPLVGHVVKLAVRKGVKEYLQMAELRVFARKPIF